MALTAQDLQCFHDRAKGKKTLGDWQAAAPQDESAVVDSLCRELIDQPGLANTGLAVNN
jgi:hypothetical protein